MDRMTCVEDVRKGARSRLPRMVFDYVESGSWSESTSRANLQGFEQLRLRQRVARSITRRDTRTRLLGRIAAMPLGVAPTGMCGLLHPEGEVAMALAAEETGIPCALSLASSRSLEDVRSAAPKAELWQQVSILKDLPFLEKLIERARHARCSALVLTLDFHLHGRRYRDLKNGLKVPPRLTAKSCMDIAMHPRWWSRMLRGPRPGLGNIIGHATGVTDMASFAHWYAGQFELDLHWGWVQWVRDRWDGALLIKGILDSEDALCAIEAGADGVVVSNHGGRQLDGAPASVQVLPAVVDAVGAKAEVWMDGGVRCGQDILKARALGATGVLAGRAPLYGLGYAGARGVHHVLHLMRAELDITMGLCGLDAVDAVDSHVLWCLERSCMSS